jgi:hypothetical protein
MIIKDRSKIRRREGRREGRKERRKEGVALKRTSL